MAGREAVGNPQTTACVQALNESTACLPLHTYRRNEDGSRERADGHWLSRVLERPNENQTGMEFRESQTATILLHGNAYARKEINDADEVTALVQSRTHHDWLAGTGVIQQCGISLHPVRKVQPYTLAQPLGVINLSPNAGPHRSTTLLRRACS